MNELSEEINNLSYQIIGCAIEVHKILKNNIKRYINT
jgi:hypothetical protein